MIFFLKQFRICILDVSADIIDKGQDPYRYCQIVYGGCSCTIFQQREVYKAGINAFIDRFGGEQELTFFAYEDDGGHAYYDTGYLKYHYEEAPQIQISREQFEMIFLDGKLEMETVYHCI